MNDRDSLYNLLILYILGSAGIADGNTALHMLVDPTNQFEINKSKVKLLMDAGAGT